VVQISGEPRRVLPPGALERMTDVMTHRGPNESGSYVADGIALGVRRLSIVDIAEGHQPIANENERVWAIQNGELYNHSEIRRELERKGHRFRTRCDTEVLPHLYEEAGSALPARLRGMFGLAVWDGVERRALIARDRLGIKPLYYARSGDLLIFASELKSLLASGLIEPVVEAEAIDAYLSFGFIPAPRTPLEGVFKLRPGHRLVIGPEGVRDESYWSYPLPSAEMPPASEREHIERLIGELEESVRLRLMSDVPLGAMLSGGLDSSLIVALMARNMSEPVKTFSIGFVEAGPSNELADARFVARAYGTDHHELELSFAEGTIDPADLLWHMDEPLADLSALGFHALSELAARDVTVALSGQGADELLGGYSRHRNALIADQWDRLPRLGRRLGIGLMRHGPHRLSRAALVLGDEDAGLRLLAMKRHIGGDLRGRLVLNADRDAATQVVTATLNGVGGDLVEKALYLDGRLSLPDDMLHYFDKMSMAHSLEVRVPFLDHHVVEYCAAIPSHLKVRGRTTKYLLKEAARGIVPDRVIEKRKVGFFNPAVDAWFTAQAEKSIAEYLLVENPRVGEFVDQAEMRRVIGDHLEGRDKRHADGLLTLLMLEVWLSTYLPRALDHGARGQAIREDYRFDREAMIGR
jgi:asparagine synthase (glutamine-hydrolysing)